MNSVFFLNNNLGYAAGGFYTSGIYGYIILKTINGGNSWTMATFTGSISG